MYEREIAVCVRPVTYNFVKCAKPLHLASNSLRIIRPFNDFPEFSKKITIFKVDICVGQ